MVKTLDDLVDRTPYQNILYEKDPDDNRLVRITLNQPERMNALVARVKPLAMQYLTSFYLV